MLIGLTGGIGSGKTTVSSELAARGAVVVDADLIARQVVEPGGRAFDAVVERFGQGVVAPDGGLDRGAVAKIVFSDEDARASLNAITHPAIRQVMAEQAAQALERGDTVVLDIPLLDSSARSRFGLDAVVVVDAPVEVAVARLVGQRGFDEADARARVAAQITRQERCSLADFVVDNSGNREQLGEEIDRLWSWIAGLVSQKGDRGSA
ncbi:MAG: dephospho-CoA kinase [Acidimicrobiales bacterium]